MHAYLVQFLKTFHDWMAVAYTGSWVMFRHGWYEALEHSPPPAEKPVCPVKQLIGISVNEQTR